LCVQGSNDRGIQAKMAHRFGVSRSTISRDFATLRRLAAPCYRCGAWHFQPPGGPTAGA
jgi:predicted DNA-binding transcriptional regulator YafY